MDTTTPLIIEVRVNESVDRRGNPALPYSPREVVEEGLLSGSSGASILHWHARDEDGREWPNDAALYRQAIEGIREQANLILHPTLGFAGTQGDVRGRVQHILELNEDPRLRFDIVPIDFGAFIMDFWDAEERRFLTNSDVLASTGAAITEMLKIFNEHGLYVLSVCWSAGGVRMARRYQEMGLLSRRTFWEFGFTGDELPGGPPPTATNLQTFVEAIPAGDPWTVHCRHGNILPLAAQAITMGGHVSIGLGDYPYSQFGNPRNCDLVKMVADMSRTLGRPVATPEQAREILHMNR